MNTPANTQAAPLTQVQNVEGSTLNKPKKSKEFWDKAAGDTYIQVENTIYRLNRKLLKKYSGILASTFSLPHNKNCEGNSPAQPIHIRQMQQVQWEHFVGKCICLNLSKRDWYLQEWTDVLYISDWLDSPMIRKYSIDQLDASTNGPNGLQPIDRLALAAQYHIPEWVSIALPGVLRIDTSRISEDHFFNMGIVFRDLIMLQNALAKNREELALHAPGLIGERVQQFFAAPDCPDHIRCCNVWSWLWWNSVSQTIFRRTSLGTRTNMDSIVQRIMEITDPTASMFAGCLDKFKANATDSFRIRLEKALIDECELLMITRCTGAGIEEPMEYEEHSSSDMDMDI